MKIIFISYWKSIKTIPFSPVSILLCKDENEEQKYNDSKSKRLINDSVAQLIYLKTNRIPNTKENGESIKVPISKIDILCSEILLTESVIWIRGSKF